MKIAPKFLLSTDREELYITHTQKPLMVCKIIMYYNKPKGLEVVRICGEIENSKLEGLKKRMFEWYIFKHHNKNQERN